MQTRITDNMNDSTYQYINLEYLELMSDGDDEMKAVMLDMLVNELPGEIEKMKKELAAQEWQTLSATSHKMKSTLSFVGNPEMIEANKDIEIICKEENETDKVPQLLEVLEAYAPKVLNEINAEMERLG